MNPVVSVVIATRDRPEMVREAIDSVYAQTLDGDIEVIVVADQSEPDLGLVRREARRSTRVISNTRSVGLAGARNSGIEAATGDYVAFCDDDDLWLPEKLERQVAALAASPGAGLSTCGIQVHYGGETFSRSLDTDLVTFDDLLRDRHTELHPSTFVMRREALLEEIGFVEEDVPGGFGEDYEFLLRAARAHAVVNVRDVLAVVRWGQQSFFFRRWETMAAGLTWLLDRYPEFTGSRRGSGRVMGQIAFAHAAMKRRRSAAAWVGRALMANPAEPRVYLALAVAASVLTPDTVMERLHRHGRGI